MYQGKELIKQELSEILASITAALILIIQLLCKYYALRIIVCINLASLVHFRHYHLMSVKYIFSKCSGRQCICVTNLIGDTLVSFRILSIKLLGMHLYL